MAAIAGIVGAIGAVTNAGATLVGIDQSNQNAKKSQDLMAEQNAQQQGLVDQQTKTAADQKAKVTQATDLANAKNNAIVENATKPGRQGSILTSPLAPLAGTKGVPNSGGLGSIGSLSTQNTGGGKTLLGA